MSPKDNDALNEEQLDEIVSLGQQLISNILARKPFDVVKAQVEEGAPLWFQDDDGTSALHAAAYVENEQLVQYLIENGAIWNSGELLRYGTFKLRAKFHLSNSRLAA